MNLTHRGQVDAVTIAPARADDVTPIVEPLWREYGEWVSVQVGRVAGLALTEADRDRHHHAFRDEVPKLLGPGGCLLVAWCDDEAVGVAALKPIDPRTAEIKRMYVRPMAQGRGIRRGLLDRLVDAARAEGCTTLRLETLRFMTAARSLYRAAGFVPTAPFAGSEAAGTVLDPMALFLACDLSGPSGVA